MFNSLRKIFTSNASLVKAYAESNGFFLSSWELNKIQEANKLASDGFSASEFYAEMVAQHGFPNAGENSDYAFGSRNSQSAR